MAEWSGRDIAFFLAGMCAGLAGAMANEFPLWLWLPLVLGGFVAMWVGERAPRVPVGERDR